MRLISRKHHSHARHAAAVALAAALVLAGATDMLAGEPARAAAWHLDSSFGKQGVAGLPVRERGVESIYPPGPGARGSLLAPGPDGSLFVGGYAHSKKGSFLVARLSADGRLDRAFAKGGVTVVPVVYSTPAHPPHMLAVAGGLLVVGLDRAHDLVVVAIDRHGKLNRAFGHGGIARCALAGGHGGAILAAATIEADRSILIAYYRHEAPQPVNEPMITPGLGEGPLELVRLLPSGALDQSFGHGGILETTGRPPQIGEGHAVGVTLAGDGSVLLAYEQASLAGTGASGFPAVQRLTPSGLDDESFGREGSALLASEPSFQGVSSSILEGLFALPGGSVEVSFGGGGQLTRFTSAGAIDPAFGDAGHTPPGPGALALAVNPDGETFTLDSRPALTVGGVLASGIPDPALGGRDGKRFSASLPRGAGGELQRAVELLAGDHSVSILVGERLMRISSS
jgi:Domain of unknown function (DUF5122) beta-propeller